MQAQIPTSVDNNSMPTLKGLKVLVAEDNTINQFMFSRMLREWQVDFEMVADGQAAVDILQEKHFDVLLLDTHMPVMDGIEVACMIRCEMSEPTRSMPIISLSASSFDDERRAAVDAGMNVIMSKPFHAVDLYNNIELLTTRKAV
ncbi:response regulator [uncultured Mucilaginibacter sp.]|uniref:response regulator n=1 Tax=uncultured Mucilaginibacter sp. TaxID=797541 RepID=UPI0025D6B739|nr:response regulator [uncultured Mucilaginibacter sp.]